MLNGSVGVVSYLLVGNSPELINRNWHGGFHPGSYLPKVHLANNGVKKFTLLLFFSFHSFIHY